MWELRILREEEQQKQRSRSRRQKAESRERKMDEPRWWTKLDLRGQARVLARKGA